MAASVLGKGDVFLTTSVVPTCTCAALFHRLDLTHLFNNKNVLLCVQQYVKRGHSRSTVRDHAIQTVSFYWSNEDVYLWEGNRKKEGGEGWGKELKKVHDSTPFTPCRRENPNVGVLLPINSP